MFREIHCLVKSIPKQPELVLDLINKCIYESLKLVCGQQNDSLSTIQEVFQIVQSQGDALSIILKSTKSSAYTLDLSIQPCGPYPYGGRLILLASRHESGKTAVRQLFTYCSYWDIKDLLGKILLENDTLIIVGGAAWRERFPKVPSQICISLSELFKPEEHSNLGTSDVLAVEKVLQDYDLPW